MLPPGRRRRRAEAVRRARRRPARRRRRRTHVADRAKPTCCPASSARPSIARRGRGATLGYLDYSHPVFEVFKAPRSGDFSAAHVFRYRALDAGPGDRVLARYDDGAVAAAERRVGAGRVIAWTTTLDDSWTDLAREAGLPAARAPARAATSRGTSRRRRGSPSARSSISRPRRQASAPTASSSRPSGERTTQPRERRRGCSS